MRLEGVHHVTAITGDAPGNLDFYTRVLGLRLVKKSVNQDDPTVYHLFYSDEQGSPGADLTFFEYPGLPPGRAGEGMVHRVLWRLGSDEALDFWADRLEAEGVEARREGESLRFADPEGLEHELLVAQVPDPPLVAEHPEVPARVALQGFHGVRAYGSWPDGSRPLLEEALGFAPIDGGWEIRGEQRGGFYLVDPPPDAPGRQGAGTVHHVAWSAGMDEQEEWRRRALAAGAHATPVIDRFYFLSVYFREPGGVLFEIATRGPGFAVDEPLESLGERVALPPFLEHRRAEIEPGLTPLPAVRAART
ncbi:MAG: glyoxalase family protein [Solirubrobacteraceae bacterium]|jgi:glyoxalase family protein|nr:glyoxalase family protein [Solirubrobacteraceae bacterium]